MKGLMLFFITFVLFAALGDNESVSPAGVSDTPYVDEQVVSTEPAAVEPAVIEPAATEPEAGESVSYDGATYEISFSDEEYYDFGAYTFLSKGDSANTIDDVWNDDGLDTRYAVVDNTTGSVKESVLLKSSDLEDIYFSHVCPANNGGYIGLAAKWTDAGAEYYFIRFDAEGNRIDMKDLSDSYKISKGGYIYGAIASDGTNYYVATQEYDKTGDCYGGILMFDENFNYVKTLVDTVTASICVGNDGLLYINDAYHGTLYSYNPAEDSLNSLEKINNCGNKIFTGRGDEILVGESVIYSYGTKTGKLTKLLDFYEYGYMVSFVNLVYRDSNGDVRIYFEDYESDSTQKCAYLKLKK